MVFGWPGHGPHVLARHEHRASVAAKHPRPPKTTARISGAAGRTKPDYGISAPSSLVRGALLFCIGHHGRVSAGPRPAALHPEDLPARPAPEREPARPHHGRADRPASPLGRPP
uniref:Envelope glycoprotein H n=1 Tax=Human herpesvirus 1 TaxID=10298 RepID=A0A109R0Q5_HHV1|nr:envelope glycoprotein H [Human alphaherpesvirus 1]